MQSKYADKIHILIGFEGEWIRPEYGSLMKDLAKDPIIDYFVGSIHHVHGMPIDYDRQTYDNAIRVCLQNHSGESAEAQPGLVGDATATGERALYAAYYDQQYEMLTWLKPRVVGHFDLIRLLSMDFERDVKAMWPDVWCKMVRNLAVVVEYGGWLECNTSALRLELSEPYPGRAVAEVSKCEVDRDLHRG